MAEAGTETKPRWWGRLQQAVSRTRTELAARMDTIWRGRTEIAPELFAELETALLGADLGVETTKEVLARLRQRAAQKQIAAAAGVKDALREELTSRLRAANARPPSEATKPHVIFLVGVNGTGKTTTLAKLAHRRQRAGQRVLLCAADTFRAAASEQLGFWAERLGADLWQQKPGADPAALVFDAITAAKGRGLDAVLVDTAGRLHTKSNLMAELEKMTRTAGKLVAGAPQEVLLVLDATTGQNGLAQARQFTAAAGVTGLVLAKLDGTAKGGIVIAIARALGLPIRYLGVGEQLDDFVDFDAEAYVASLFD